MSWFVQYIDLMQQQRGPIQNITVTVTAKNKSDEDESYDKKSGTYTVDDKVDVFFKPRFSKEELTLYVNIQKKESVQNCNVEITCQEFRKVIPCSKEWIEVQVSGIQCSHISYSEILVTPGIRDGRVWKCWRQYIFQVNITVHDMMSVSIHNKLYEDTEFTDFELKATDGAIAVHKTILTFQSDMFKTMLRGEWKETVEGCVNIDGVTRETLQHLKDYMYLGTLPDEGLEPLILLAEHYLMDKLKSDCITKLVKSVKPENFDTIIKFACHSGIAEELMLALICGIFFFFINLFMTMVTKTFSRKHYNPFYFTLFGEVFYKVIAQNFANNHEVCKVLILKGYTRFKFNSSLAATLSLVHCTIRYQYYSLNNQNDQITNKKT